MRNLHREAAIWNLFTSIHFFEAAAKECDQIAKWFVSLAVSREVANFGRNNQIYETLRALRRDFERGAKLAAHGDYKVIWDVARCVRGDIRGIMEQPLHSWMTESEYQEFDNIKIARLAMHARRITRVFNNAMTRGHGFADLIPNCPERLNDDDGFPGDDIVGSYGAYRDAYKCAPPCMLPDPFRIPDRWFDCMPNGRRSAMDRCLVSRDRD